MKSGKEMGRPAFLWERLYKCAFCLLKTLLTKILAMFSYLGFCIIEHSTCHHSFVWQSPALLYPGTWLWGYKTAWTKTQIQQDALWHPWRKERIWGIPTSYILYHAFPFSLFLPGPSGLGSASSIQAAVRQLEAEADAIIQMVREGQRARRQQQAATVSMMPVAPHSFLYPPSCTMSSVGVHCPFLVCFCIMFAKWMPLDNKVTFCWCFSYCSLIVLLVCIDIWLNLKLGHHTPLLAVQLVVFCKLSYAQCLGSRRDIELKKNLVSWNNVETTQKSPELGIHYIWPLFHPGL